MDMRNPGSTRNHVSDVGRGILNHFGKAYLISDAESKVMPLRHLITFPILKCKQEILSATQQLGRNVDF